MGGGRGGAGAAGGAGAGGAVRITVRAVPRGGRDAVDGVTDAGELRCRVSAAPADGAANKALLRLVADACGVPPTRITLEAGATSRTKRLRIEGVAVDDLRARWPSLRVEAVRG